MIEVRFSTYSAEAWPSGTRPTPAKKRSVSLTAGISSSRNALRGLPASAASRSDSSSACSSRMSASFSIAVARSAGVVVDQPGKAPFAAATARFTSSSVESGMSAITSPFAGLVTSSVAPSAESTDSPSMKFWSLLLLTVAMCVCGPLLGLGDGAQYVVNGCVRHSGPLGHGLVRDLAVHHVHARLQPGHLLDGALEPVVGEREHEGERGVGERERRGHGHCTRHVRHAVVGHPVDLVDGIGVGRGT